ncbi:MAG: hypothetical protein M5U12_27450 [Verrucomicrobia bacterium]|nr:hypothetical protein [Verrucomicrobiota bacterium]
MNPTSLLLAAALVVGLPRASALTLATQGATEYQIVTQAGATPAELNAARELAETLAAVTGATFPRTRSRGRPAVARNRGRSGPGRPAAGP